MIVTGYGTTANEDRARAAGVTAFMRKPLSPEMIEASASQALLPPTPAMAAPQQTSMVGEAPVEPLTKESRLKNVALFLAAPFIGLAYAVLLPFVGIAMLAWAGGRALRGKPPVA